MVEALAAFAAKEILKKVISLTAQEIGLVWSFKKDVKKLRDSLVFIQALLQDAEESQLESKAIKIWLQKLQDLAHDTEDVLHKFDYELLRRKIEVGTHLKKVCSFFSSSNPIVVSLKIGHKIRTINKSLDKIRSESNGLELVRVRYIEKRIEETDSFLENSENAGWKDKDCSMVDIIAQNPISIVRMPSSGQTIRIRNNKVEENSLLDKVIRPVESNSSDEQVILRAMLESFDKTIKNVGEKLKSKNFYENHWKMENKRNYIVVTTHSEQVYLITKTSYAGLSMRLNVNKYWSISKEKILDEEVTQTS